MRKYIEWEHCRDIALIRDERYCQLLSPTCSIVRGPFSLDHPVQTFYWADEQRLLTEFAVPRILKNTPFSGEPGKNVGQEILFPCAPQGTASSHPLLSAGHFDFGCPDWALGIFISSGGGGGGALVLTCLFFEVFRTPALPRRGVSQSGRHPLIKIPLYFSVFFYPFSRCVFFNSNHGYRGISSNVTF